MHDAIFMISQGSLESCRRLQWKLSAYGVGPITGRLIPTGCAIRRPAFSSARCTARSTRPHRNSKPIGGQRRHISAP